MEAATSLQSGRPGRAGRDISGQAWPEQFKTCTRKFARDVIGFCARLPNRRQFWVISNQLVKSTTSVAANYRSACRAQSAAAFLSKMSVVEEEADESLFWLELLDDLKTRDNPELTRLRGEAAELLAITVAAKKTTRRRASR